jgi:hypothetical protein
MAQYHNSGIYVLGQSYAFNAPASTFIPAVEFAAGATDRPIITEIGFTTYSQAANIPAEMAIGLAPAQGIGGYYNSPVSGPYDGVSSPSALSIFTAWQIKPTVPTNFFRRYLGQEQVLVTETTQKLIFPHGLTLAQNTSVVLYLFTLLSGHGFWGEFYVEFDE